MGLMFPIYFLSVVLSAGLALMSAYQILELSDLECSHISAKKCCANLSKVVVPEILCVGLLCFIHAVTFNWFPVVTTLPILGWGIYFHQTTPKRYSSFFDDTDILEPKIFNSHVQKCLFKVIVHLLHFFVFMYLAVTNLATV